MELYNNTRVQFIETPHTYLLDGERELIGVTSLMKKHGLSPDYGGIDEAVLQHAATLGSMAHQVIENYCNGLPTVDSPLIESFAKLNLNIIATEYLVSDNETTASKVDLVEGVDETSVILWDVKRTAAVHRKALAWQLGIYKYIFEKFNPAIKVVACKCLPVKKGNKDDIERDICGEPVDITPVPAEEVERLLDCERKGDRYEAMKAEYGLLATVVSEDEMRAVCEASQTLAEFAAIINNANEVISRFKDKVYQFMLENNIDEIYEGGLALKLKRPYVSNKFDSAKFKKDHPELSGQYTKATEVKGNVSITTI